MPADGAVATAYPMVFGCMVLYTGDDTRAGQIAVETATQMYGSWALVRRQVPTAWALRYAYGLAQRGPAPAAPPPHREGVLTLAREPRLALAMAVASDLTLRQRAWVLGHRVTTVERWTNEALATLQGTPALAPPPPPPALDLDAIRPHGRRLAHRNRLLIIAILTIAALPPLIVLLLTLRPH